MRDCTILLLRKEIEKLKGFEKSYLEEIKYKEEEIKQSTEHLIAVRNRLKDLEDDLVIGGMCSYE